MGAMKGGGIVQYFKYKNTNKNRNNALKEQYKSLTRDEKRTFRKAKRWTIFSHIAALLIFIFFMKFGIFLLDAIPLPSAWLPELLVIIAKAILGLGLLMIGIVFAVALTMPLWKKVESFHIPSMKKEIFSKSCEHLRNYYRLQEPYIITKCFDATDGNFRNHDVCIFVAGDELRMTADLVHGFLHGKRDLGCYAFTRDEITVSKQQEGNRLVAELKVGDAVFFLGYRAKGYIEKNFMVQSSK